jgi:L-fuconolactonase
MEGNIIDSHQHFWRPGLFDYPWMSEEVEVLYRDYMPSDLEPVLNDCGVSKTVLVQASNSLAETRWLLSLADKNQFIAGVVGWIDLTAPDVEEQLIEFIAHPKFKGVRHLVESEASDDWLIQPGVIKGMRVLSSKGVTYDLLVHTRHLKHVKTLLEKCPDGRFVVDHLAKPPIASGEIKEWLQEIRNVANFPNVYCKLSGLVTEADHKHWRTEDLKPFVDCAIELFGTRRLMFGSDYPVCLLAASYSQVLESFQTLLSEINADDLNHIFAKNASEFYGL